MLERASPVAVTVGRWGIAVSLVIGAVLVGCVIRRFPYLLPNRLPGLVLYELGPGLVLTLAIGNAIAITSHAEPRLGIQARLALFALAALLTGTIALAIEYRDVLQGQWL